MATSGATPDATPPQSGPIAIYGATGFTGTLIAQELRRLGAEFLIAGRSADKLEALSADLGGIPFAVAEVSDDRELRRLLEPCSTVVACAGPFTLHGEPVLAAATETGTHYLDTTGEQPFIKLSFDRYGERAAANGAAIVSGMGFDYAPGDLIAALTAERMGPLDEITVAYCVHGFAPTHGTALSALEMMRGGDVVWRDGAWQPAPRSAGGGSWQFAEPLGKQRMLRYPAGEQITVPKHIDVRRVRTLLNGMVVPPRLMPLATAAAPIMGLAMRTPLRRATGGLIRRLPTGPNEKQRAVARFVIECMASVGTRSRRGVVRGTDVYGLTAAGLAHAALLCADPSFERSGALAPAQAFEPAPFLDAMAGSGLSYEVDALPAAAAFT